MSWTTSSEVGIKRSMLNHGNDETERLSFGPSCLAAQFASEKPRLASIRRVQLDHRRN
jgi:hypothetical protein